MNPISNSLQISNKPFFSIIIPTLNEEKYLPKLLQDLSQQTFNDFEVLHVDAQSTDKTIDLAGEYAQQLNLKTLISEQKNVSFQRNLGASQAKANWIIFMDADNSLPSYFLQGIKYQIDKNCNMDGFTCWLDVEGYQPKYKPTAQLINFGLSTLNNLALGSILGVKKQAFEKIRFDENLFYGEDSEFVKDFSDAGFIFICLKEPRYTYSMRRFDKEGALKMSKIFLEGRLHLLIKNDVESFKKYPMLGGNYYSQNQQTKLIEFIEKADLFLKKASANQLQTARKIWKKIIED